MLPVLGRAPSAPRAHEPAGTQSRRAYSIDPTFQGSTRSPTELPDNAALFYLESRGEGHGLPAPGEVDHRQGQCPLWEASVVLTGERYIEVGVVTGNCQVGDRNALPVRR